MIFAIVLIVVGAILAVIGFNCMKPKNGDIPVSGGGYVNVPPEERPQVVKDAGKIMLGIGLIMVAGGIVWIVSKILMSIAGIVLGIFLLVLAYRIVRIFI